ncbi:Autophagy-related protein 13b [Hirschfeldia incana]|nr:Autophagy-related protein 13b [Hirschfeldia incana]
MNRGSSNSEGAKAEQIIFEFFAKSLHIILESRTPFMSSRNFSGEQMICSPSSSSSSSSSVRPRDKWFNLALRECPAALESFDIGRRSTLEPLVVDVVLVASPFDQMNSPGGRELIRNFSGKEYLSDQDELGCEGKNEQIIERWVVQYDNRKVKEPSRRSSSSSSNKLQVMYKKATLLLRSLFAMVRLLPAYKIFRELNSSGQIFKFKLVPKVPTIVEPFTRREEAEMHKFAFTPVDTICGRLCMSVLYRSLSDVSCSQHSAPVSPTFITDYVGSPLADPLKRFPSLPLSYGSPPLMSFQRRHSWSFDPPPPSVSCSPSPTHSDFSQALVTNPSSLRRLPPHPCDIPSGRRKENYAEEYLQDFSPPCSPSGQAVPRSITRTESAPVRIPAPSFQSKQNVVVAPSSHLKLARHASLKPVRNAGPVESGAALEKLNIYGREDFRRNSGVKLSTNSSPRISLSRSSSRSYRDDFDDTDFPCPFDVEYDEITDPSSSRPGSFEQRGDAHEPPHELSSGSYPKKSQDAEVGALVNMLKKAPPLRQDVSESSISELCWNNNKNKPGGGQEIATASMTASGIALAAKTTADALEELRSYKDMRNVLLSQSKMDSSSPFAVSES